MRTISGSYSWLTGEITPIANRQSKLRVISDHSLLPKAARDAGPSTDQALERLADTFLQDVRAVSGIASSGWGQFVSQTGGTQVGLYGTCAGVIVVASAYGHTRVPQPVTAYLTQLWSKEMQQARNRLHFQEQGFDTREISKELGVRYVLEGSVQRDQNRVRVNVQLIDGGTDWANQFEESITDLFKLQDQVVARLANTLGYELVRAEAQRSTRTQLIPTRST